MSNDSKHKLFNYEVMPPAEVWQKISSELDESDISNQYPARLRQFEVSPPPAIWEKISGSLDPVKQFPASAEKRRLAPIFKYAAAAAIITLFIWGGIQLLNNGSDKIEIAKDGENQVKQDTANFTENTTNSNNSDLPSIAESSSNTEQDIRDAAALEESKKTYANLDIPVRSKLKDVSNFYFTPESDFSSTRSIDFSASGDDPEKDLADRYVMLMTPDGNIIRMSKKLGDFVCCVAGEEQDPNCVNQIKSLQEKIANSSIGHSPGNFLDILNLVNFLQKNAQ
ncbi:MAG TPA: hypothetical protein PKC72_08585 [Chitinophagaceae bacterium]|nr:hypothetical protein [Chitinophagaceae bacterium]